MGYNDIIAFDTDPGSLQSAVDSHSVSPVASLAEGISKAPAAALVCTPNHLHLTTALPLAEAGIHLFIEKPLDVSLDRVPDLERILHRNRTISMVGCNFRFDAGMQIVKRALEENTIGRPLSLRSTFGYYLPDWRPGRDYRKNYAVKRETGGGVILDRMHEIDYVLWLFGDVKSIHGFASRIGQLELETEDNADIVFQHVTGAVSSIHLDYLRREYLCTCEITGTDGTLIWDFKNRSVQLFLASTKTWKDLSASIPEDSNSMYIAELGHFIRCIMESRPTVNPISEGARTLEIVLKTKKRVLRL